MVQTPTARTTNTWDDENRRTKVLLPGGAITTSTYRWDGLRYKKQTSAETKKFVFDGKNYLLETNASDVVQAVCTNSPGQYGNLISQYDFNSAAAVYHHYDVLGSTRQLTDSSRSVVNTYIYDAWGQAVSISQTVSNFFRWIGELGYYFDDEVDGYYVRARHYDTVIGRWSSQDPLFYPNGSIGYDRSEWNLYKYANGNPLTRVDPSGRIVPVVIVGGVACCGVGIGMFAAAAQAAAGPCTAAFPNNPAARNRCIERALDDAWDNLPWYSKCAGGTTIVCCAALGAAGVTALCNSLGLYSQAVCIALGTWMLNEAR